MSLELVADDGCSTVLPLFASTNQIRVQTIRIMLGSTMVELSNTTHEANWSTSFDVPLQQRHDPVPPLSSCRDATAAIPLPQEITPSPRPQPQATEASATCAVTGTTNVATVEKQESKKTENNDKREKWANKMRGWFLVVATVFATMTYQAGLTPPGGFWSEDQTPSQPSCNGTSVTNVTTPCHENTTIVCITSSDMASPSNATRHEAGNPILQDKNRERYKVFFWTNSAAFVYSMGSIVFLLSDTVSNKLNSSGYKLIMLINAFIILGAYSAGCSRDFNSSTFPLAAMVFFVVFSAGDAIFRKNSGRRMWRALAAGVPEPA